MNLESMSVNELNDRALAASEGGDWERALELAEAALRQEPENYLSFKRLSLALWYLERRPEAVDALKKSVQIKSDFDSGYYNLACFFAQLEDKQQMLTALKRAIDLEDTNRSLAQGDEDFKAFQDDADFSALVRPGALDVHPLKELFAGDDYPAISTALDKLGQEISLESIDWEGDDDGGADLSGMLESKAEFLDYEALVNVFKVILKQDLDYFEAFPALLQALRDKGGRKFDSLLVEEWKILYGETDPGHLGAIEYNLLDALGEIPAELAAQVAVWGLLSHGPDAVEDYNSLCASILEKLPKQDKLRTELVELLDTLIHKDLYAGQDFATRQQRVLMALPAPTLTVERSLEDPWAYQRAALAHSHPALVIQGAQFLSRQSNPVAVELARGALERLRDFVLDDALPVDLRLDAVTIIETLGDASSIAALGPALEDRSIQLLEFSGRLFHRAGLTPAQTNVAVDTILAARDNDPYKTACALRWFNDARVTPTLVELINKENEATRREALYGLGTQKADAALDTIVEQLRQGSSQCVSAAARALADIGSDAAQAALFDSGNYELVLEKVKQSPRFTTAALLFFKLERCNQDLLELFGSLKEREAYPVLAQGLAEQAQESSLPGLLELGLDRYRGKQRLGRDYVMIFRSIARANPAGPDTQVLSALEKILSQNESKDIDDFAKQLNRDGEYAELADPTPNQTEAEKHYAATFRKSFASISPEAKTLATALFHPKTSPD